jgi:hypothetical protein
MYSSIDDCQSFLTRTANPVICYLGVCGPNGYHLFDETPQWVKMGLMSVRCCSNTCYPHVKTLSLFSVFRGRSGRKLLSDTSHAEQENLVILFQTVRQKVIDKFIKEWNLSFRLTAVSVPYFIFFTYLTIMMTTAYSLNQSTWNVYQKFTTVCALYYSAND